MAPNFHSSFIPKEPITQEVFKKEKAGFAGILAAAFLGLMILASVGLYFYKGIVKNEIKVLEAELVEAEKSIDKTTINELAKFSKKLNMVEAVVTKHQVISKFLTTLASSTVGTIYFESFDYGNLEVGKLDVNLTGRANSYAAVALQESVLNQNKYFKSVVFSGLTLVEGGAVSFKLNISVDPQIVAAFAP